MNDTAAWASARRQYEYDHETLSPFVVSATVPPEELYSTDYHVAQMDALVLAARNMALVPTRDPAARFAERRELVTLFTLLPRPDAVIEHHWKDWAFAEQRLAGPNPMILRRVHDGAELRDYMQRVPLTSECLVQALGADASPRTFEEAVDRGRLFVADYELLEDLPAGSWSGGRKHLAAPIAFFVWRTTGQRDRGELAPVAIQLAQRWDESPLFTPAHPAWRLAKHYVQVADANHHEMVSHLAFTHLAMEPIAVATARCLPPTHPVRRVLAPHLRFVIARNAEARARLIDPDGPVDALLASTLSGSLELARRGRAGRGRTRAWGLRSHAFEEDLRRRGLWDGDALPHFPYRDDGKLLWDAMGQWIASCVTRSYAAQDDLARDGALQDWLREMRDPDAANVPDVGVVDTPHDLVQLLRTIAFTCGPQHAASNYPQFEYMGFVANMPLAAYVPPPGSPHLRDEEVELALAKALPPFGQAVQQLITMHGLSAYRPDRLGDPATLDSDPRLADARSRYAGALRAADETITRRNAVRRMPYPYLQPALVPNACSV